MVKAVRFHCREHGLIPGQRSEILHVSQHDENQSLLITNAGEGVEENEPCSTVGGNVNW